MNKKIIEELKDKFTIKAVYDGKNENNFIFFANEVSEAKLNQIEERYHLAIINNDFLGSFEEFLRKENINNFYIDNFDRQFYNS